MITIGKLAALFEISHHQIRYYEDKDLFSPTEIDQNGYRKYDLEAVYRLAQILLLRELELGTTEIKHLQQESQGQDTQRLLQEKITDIEAMIRKLSKTKAQLERQLRDEIKPKERKEKIGTFYLEKVLTLKQTEKLTADNIMAVVDLDQLLLEDLYYLFEQDNYHLCKKMSRPTQNSIEIPSGSYDVYTDYVEEEEESDRKLAQLLETYQRLPDFVIERNTFSLNQLNKVEIGYYYKC